MGWEKPVPFVSPTTHASLPPAPTEVQFTAHGYKCFPTQAMVCTSYHRTSLSLFEHTSASAPLGEVKKSTAFVMPLSSWVTRVLCETPD